MMSDNSDLGVPMTGCSAMMTGCSATMTGCSARMTGCSAAASRPSGAGRQMLRLQANAALAGKCCACRQMLRPSALRVPANAAAFGTWWAWPCCALRGQGMAWGRGLLYSPFPFNRVTILQFGPSLNPASLSFFQRAGIFGQPLFGSDDTKTCYEVL